MKKILLISFLMIALLIVAGCSQGQEADALAGLATKAEYTDCKNDADCWNQFTQCQASCGTRTCQSDCLDAAVLDMKNKPTTGGGGASGEGPGVSGGAQFAGGACESTEFVAKKGQSISSTSKYPDFMVHIDGSDLPTLLANGSFAGSPTKQELWLSNNASVDYLESDDDQVLDDYLYLNISMDMMFYQLYFDPIETGIKPTAKYDDSKLGDFIGKELQMFGNQFKVAYATIPVQGLYGLISQKSLLGKELSGEQGLALTLKGTDSIFYHLIDKDISDKNYGELWVSSALTGEFNKVSGVGVLMKGKPVDWLGDKSLSLNYIYIRMRAQDDYYVNEGGLSKAVVSQGDDAELIFPNNLNTRFWDVRLKSYDKNSEQGVVEVGKWC